MPRRRPWKRAVVARALETADLAAALEEAKIGLGTYLTARADDPAFDAECRAIDDLLARATTQAQAIAASRGDRQAARYLARYGPPRSPREEARASPLREIHADERAGRISPWLARAIVHAYRIARERERTARRTGREPPEPDEAREEGWHCPECGAAEGLPWLPAQIPPARPRY